MYVKEARAIETRFQWPDLLQHPLLVYYYPVFIVE